MTYEHNPMASYKTRLMNSRKVREVPEFKPVKSGPSLSTIALFAAAAFVLGVAAFSLF